ncbi:hypothetical protein OROGR_032855 [Orobanche gracilis]
MPFKFIFRKQKGTNSISKQPIERKCELNHRDLHFTCEGSSSSSYPMVQQSMWASFPSELLLDIIGRVEADENTWPARRAVVSCAAVCKSWREITREVIKTPEECGLLTFPMSLKQKAYDKVPREVLWWALAKKGVSRKYIDIIKDMYEGASTSVRTNVGRTEEFPITIGVHQGSALSPFLFAIVMDELTRGIQNDVPWCMMFADDIVLIDETKVEVQQKLELWRDTLEARGFRLSRSKTKYMECRFSDNSDREAGMITFDGKVVHGSTFFRYLGSIIQKDGELDGDVAHRIKPGPRDSPIQCFIRRDRATSTYRLYLGLSPALLGDASKLLLAAKRINKATKTDLLISFTLNDFSQTSDNYAGKLRSNFFGSKFFIHDCQPPCNSASIQSHGWSWKRISAKKVAPRLPVCNYNIATIAYELNVLRTRGPRRMHCTMHSIPFSAIQEDGTAPTPVTICSSLDMTFCPLAASGERKQNSASGSIFRANTQESIGSTSEPLILKNKTPRWHEQLQCWCLHFRGRVTVASVKNFQLVAAVHPSHSIPASEQDKVILQFGKIGKDVFTMDYQYPLSAFQAFAICLSTFDTKPVCE